MLIFVTFMSTLSMSKRISISRHQIQPIMIYLSLHDCYQAGDLGIIMMMTMVITTADTTVKGIVTTSETSGDQIEDETMSFLNK
jgi:hypothetical protein